MPLKKAYSVLMIADEAFYLGEALDPGPNLAVPFCIPPLRVSAFFSAPIPLLYPIPLIKFADYLSN